MPWNAILLLFSGLSFLAYGGSCLGSPRMREEFTRFGLARFRIGVGLLELLGGAGQLLGLALGQPGLALAASAGLAALMGLGVGARIRIRDGLLLLLPALGYAALNAALVIRLWPQ